MTRIARLGLVALVIGAGGGVRAQSPPFDTPELTPRSAPRLSVAAGAESPAGLDVDSRILEGQRLKKSARSKKNLGIVLMVSGGVFAGLASWAFYSLTQPCGDGTVTGIAVCGYGQASADIFGGAIASALALPLLIGGAYEYVEGVDDEQRANELLQPHISLAPGPSGALVRLAWTF